MSTSMSTSISPTPVAADAAQHRADAFDLTAVERSLLRDGFTAESAARAVQEYRAFLRDAMVDPAARVAPSRLADEAWHRHILDTRAYYSFCHDDLGFFLHHEPRPAGQEARDPDQGPCLRWAVTTEGARAGGPQEEDPVPCLRWAAPTEGARAAGPQEEDPVPCLRWAVRKETLRA